MENMINDEMMLRLTGIRKSFGSLEVLKGIDLELKKGEVMAIIGPSGSGKSTLLRCINRLEEISSGKIEIKNHILVQNNADNVAEYVSEKEARQILSCTGMVFQQFNLFPHMTVMENLLEAPVLVQKRNKEEVMVEAEALLKKVGLLDKKDAYPLRLSGGQQQRVAIARALCMKPDIMLFDEPTSALDPELTGEVLRTMRELAAEHTTMLVVTHEMAFAREAANHVVFMDGGVIVEQGTAQQVIDNPQEERTRDFLKNML